MTGKWDAVVNWPAVAVQIDPSAQWQAPVLGVWGL